MRILVVEDEYKLAHALQKGLTLEGYAVDVTYNGDDGLANALNDPYDVIILDRMLPGGYDGIAIVREMRKEKIQIPVLMLTAKDSVPDRVAGLDAGANDYLIKPFAFEELLARLRSLTRTDAVTDIDSLVEYQGLSLNLKTKQAHRDGVRIGLSLKEFSLLDYMIRNPEVVLTKQQIIDHVWNYDADILPNTVEAFIAMLRAKIDKPFKSATYIHTVRGFGYTMHKK